MLNRYFCMSEPNRSGKLSHLPNRTDINCCGIPNCAILKMRLQGAPRANTYHAQECVPWGRLRTTRQCAPRANTYHAPMRITRENAYHARECVPRANGHHAAECVMPRANAYHVRSTRHLNSSCNGKSSICSALLLSRYMMRC